jgi:nitronate monooxygenase
MDIMNRVRSFCDRFGLQLPILLAPMAGASAPSLSAAVMSAGGLGACGALLLHPDEIQDWARTVQSQSNGPFQLNLWVPDPSPVRDRAQEAAVREFLLRWGPEVPESAGDETPPDFEAQCEALLKTQAPVISSVMGLFPTTFVRRLKASGRPWFATVSTVAEAKLAEAAGADVIVAQGMEAGGHRAAFRAERADQEMVGLLSLIPNVVDAVQVPVVATGGIADGRGIAAALALGASAVQIGTGFLRCPEAQIHSAWADAIGRAKPEDTRISRVFSGRYGRAILTGYVEGATAPGAPTPAPYPVQRGLTGPMRRAAAKEGDVNKMQAWAGQSGALARAEPAEALTKQLWSDARAFLR